MNNLFRDLRFAFGVVLVILLVTTLINFFLGGELTWSGWKVTVLYNMYYGIPLCLLNGWFNDHLNRIVPWEQHALKRAWAGIIGTILVTMLALITLNFFLWTLIMGKPISYLWIQENRQFYLIALLITAIVSISLHAISFFQGVQKEKLVSARLRQEKLASELSALRTHVDPHFLFNSFNVLSGLIDEDRERAQDFLAELSGIYRYILEHRNEDVSSVADELAFAKRYLNLQRMRFEDSIYLHTEISENAMRKTIPSLSLQLLMENAIKHNGFDAETPLDIEIREDNGALLVRNNRKTRHNLHKGKGIGLQNIRDRYALLSQPDFSVEQEENSFTVKLPLI